MTRVADDVWTVFWRESLPGLREPAGLLFAVFQPLVFLALFGPLLSGVAEVPGASAWQWFVPSVLVMLALFWTANIGYSLLTDMATGSHERLLVTPMSRHAIAVGRALKAVAELVVQGLLIVAVVVPFGFELHPVGALLGFVGLVLLGVAAGTLSDALAIASGGKHEIFYTVQSSLVFPLLFLSGMMLPLDTGPGWMQAVGRINPLTWVVDGMRAAFAGEVGGDVAVGLATAAGLAAIGVVLVTRGMAGAVDR
ncbi:ABC transporter permease [Euzebya sp.]|uniref:ABC transporter permease n=1 Tax=Euzebya sp. TaxID=1971409 RepID=UPI0035195E71